MIQRLYDWMVRQAVSPYAIWVLAGVSFLESSVFPIPPDVLMIPMILARPAKAWLIALVCLLASVAGALLGYFIGAVLFDTVGLPVLELYGKTGYFDEFATRYNEWGAWAVLIAGITPFPFKVITILSGSTGLSLPVFIAASIIARGVRFYLVAALLRWFGPPVRDFIERRLGLMFILFFVILIGGFYLVRFL
ncbi:cytochrome B [Brevirhabdus pacifica]|uniref:Cytochrome B n=1 Tax=Brevirhabdus pacifica TaxID=1267768 RepID=A0A1U7DFA7_9RHOB|nr:YqaA family protein [Brevirhabdus pacifica]APX88690.1 cytochrome B [Brevirhabdus pacifica]OWU79955.1 cytochrome B561 [Loktanella sp. 22II-4b]PJJ86800.1 membrane protein YqaA with SNARE-associated domain [Brevirhabdus pacifica]